MMKFTAILVFMLIGSLLAGRVCNSCGQECVPACGTRRFRSCCFNYLRRKRGPEMLQMLFSEQGLPVESQTADLPYFLNEVIPGQGASSYYMSH